MIVVSFFRVIRCKRDGKCFKYALSHFRMHPHEYPFDQVIDASFDGHDCAIYVDRDPMTAKNRCKASEIFKKLKESLGA